MANALAKNQTQADPEVSQPAQEQQRPMTAVEKFQLTVRAEVNIVRGQLTQMGPQFQMALPKHMPLERFERVVLTACQNNPDLMFKVTRQSFFNACMRAAQDGLLPDGREGAIVPMADKASWIPMVYGLRKKVRNSGELVDWDVHLVYENDEFNYALGDNPFIFHKPAMNQRGKLVGGYSIAHLKDGGTSREVMGIEAIEEIRKQASRAKSPDSPWNVAAYYPEMCRKTIARRHSKMLPMSSDLDDLLRRDDDIYDLKPEAVTGDQPKQIEQRRERPRLGDALDALAGPAADAEAKQQAEPEQRDKAAEQAQEQKEAQAQPAQSENPAPPSEQKPSGDAAAQSPQASGTAGAPSQPETTAAPAAAPKQPRKAETEKPPALPTDEKGYQLFAKTWIDATTTAPALRERWQNVKEKNLRNTCNVSPDGRERIYEYLMEREKAIIASTP